MWVRGIAARSKFPAAPLVAPPAPRFVQGLATSRAAFSFLQKPPRFTFTTSQLLLPNLFQYPPLRSFASKRQRARQAFRPKLLTMDKIAAMMLEEGKAFAEKHKDNLPKVGSAVLE